MDICYKTSNSIYDNLPPKMSDGRHFTDYRSNCLVNNLLMNNNKNMTSTDFKNFMINNANSLRDINRTYIRQKNSSPLNERCSDLSAKYKIFCNKQTCRKVLINPNGFGTDIEYGITYNKPIQKTPYIPNKCSNNFNYRY